MPLNATIVEVHDREPALLKFTSLMHKTVAASEVETWPALLPTTPAAGPENAPTTLVHHRGPDLGTPPAKPLPLSQTPSAPVRGDDTQAAAAPSGMGGPITGGFSALMPTDSVPNRATFWQRALSVGRVLASVFVLPNLAPPG